MGLERYRHRRDFGHTPEPAGDASVEAGIAIDRFVLHEHHARRLHWDLRLERGGVLWSFALPRGLPDDPRRNNLAVRTEDHPLEYLQFAGQIPRGLYGAGQMLIVDTGTYVLVKNKPDEVIIDLRGSRLGGRYALIHTRDDQWLIHRMTAADDPSREPMPEGFTPMLAKPGVLPRNDHDYAFEISWDGVRALVFSSPGQVRVRNRTGADITTAYPELRGLAGALGRVSCILDGEIVCLGLDGAPGFERLAARMHVTSDSRARRLAQTSPVTFQIFDLVWLEGHFTTSLAYTRRRELLQRLELHGPHWDIPAYHTGDGQAMLQASLDQGLEGLVAKRLDSVYEPGRRSGAWIKIKNTLAARVVIGGYTHGAGDRDASIGALAIGLAEPGGLVYAGKVGSGLAGRTLQRVEALLSPITTTHNPFTRGAVPRGVVFVEPRYEAVVAYTEKTRAGALRHPRLVSLEALPVEAQSHA